MHPSLRILCSFLWFALGVLLMSCQATESPQDFCEQCQPSDICDAQLETCTPAEQSTESPEPECQEDIDCGDATQKCVAQECVPKCEGVFCDASLGEVCDPTTGECVGGSGCQEDADCLEAERYCDNGQCVGGRRAPCDEHFPCETGLDCTPAFDQSQCLQACESHDECLNMERCLDGSENLGGIAGHCFPNLCRPEGEFQYVPNLIHEADYAGDCQVFEMGDGICIGPLFNNPNFGQTGLCYRRGSANAGEPCSNSANQAQADKLCVGGICDDGGGAQEGVCRSACTLLDEELCPSENGQATGCFPLWEHQGICVSLTSAPGALGDSCAPVSGELPCVENTLCTPAADGSAGPRCQAICDTLASEDSLLYCEHCASTDGLNAPLGYCPL